MSTSPWLPSVQAAFADRRLTSLERVAFLWLTINCLDIHRFQALKAVHLQLGIRCKKRTAHQILDRLSVLGYLHVGVNHPDAPAEARAVRPRWYRLAYHVALPTVPSRTTGRPDT